jgi:hypothetical protein
MGLVIASDPGAHCTLSRHFRFDLEWKPEKDYPAGSKFEFRGDRGRSFNKWKYVRMNTECADVLFRWKLYPTVTERKQNRDLVLFRAVLPYGTKKDVPCRISLTVIPPVWSELDLQLSVWTADIVTIPPGSEEGPEYIREPGSQCNLQVLPGPVERLSIYSKGKPGSDGKVRTAVVPEDRVGNPGMFSNSINAEFEWNGEGFHKEIKEPEIIYLEKSSKIERLKMKTDPSEP